MSKVIINFIFSIAIAIFWSFSLYAEPYTVLAPVDLTQALTNTYNYNPELQASLEQLKSIGNNAYKATAEFLPTVNAKISRGKDYQNVKTGGIPSSNTRGAVTNDSIELNQPIFNSGMSVFGVKANKKSFFASVASFSNIEQQILMSAIQAYTNVLSTKEALDINLYNVKVLTQSLQYAEERFEVGDATRADVAEAKSQLSRALAYKAKAEGTYESAKAKFKQITGIENVNLAMIQENKDLSLNLQDLISIASNNHPAIISARLGVDAKKDFLVRSKLSILPSASVSASASRISSPYGFTNVQKISQKVHDKRVMLNVNIPIYQSGLEYMDMRKSKIDVQQSKYSFQQAKEQIIENVIESWNNLLSYTEAFKSSMDAVEASAITLENMKQEEEVGTRTILDVLEAEYRLFNTKLELNESKYSKILSSYALKAAIGDLTAQKLKLPVKIFDAEAYYDRAKKQIIGFSEE